MTEKLVKTVPHQPKTTLLWENKTVKYLWLEYHYYHSTAKFQHKMKMLLLKIIKATL